MAGFDYKKEYKDLYLPKLAPVKIIVPPEVFAWACAETARKKGVDTAKARLETFDEGLCVHCMHIGPFDDEPATVAKTEAFIRENGLINDIGSTRRHHEISLSDPRRTAPDKMKTVLRIPVRAM